jgi:hypothetical protein
MPSANVTLEPSEGPTIRNPTKEQIHATLLRIGNGLEHCVLELGGETEFLQAAGTANRLLIQYRDATGMFESTRADLDVETVERAFVEAMGGATAWKTALNFRRTDAPGESGSPERSAPSSPKRSPEEELLDAAKRKAKEGVNKLIKGGLRKLFGGKP